MEYAGIRLKTEANNMSKKRFVDTQFWRDNYISNLDPSEKLVFLYLLTNPDTNISGIYQIPLKTIATDTGFDKEMIIKILDRFEEDQKIKYENGWVAIKNFIKNQNEKSQMVIKGIQNEIKKAPEMLRKWVKNGKTEDIDTLSHININPDININLTEAENYPAEVVDLTNYFYSKMIKPTKYINKPPDLSKWYKHIYDLKKLDNIDYELIKKVIDFAVTDPFWKLNIQSTSSLRDKFNKLELKMKGANNFKKPIMDNVKRFEEMEKTL